LNSEQFQKLFLPIVLKILWLGTTIKGLLAFPRSIASYIDNIPESVFPKPTSCDKAKEVGNSLREDASITHRNPYPQNHEIKLPRKKIID